MIKLFAAASVLTIGLAGHALAQGTITGAPAGKMPVTQAPPASTATRPYHHHYRHMARHFTHRIPSRAAAAPNGAAPQGGTQP
jgi:hypothetical protein